MVGNGLGQLSGKFCVQRMKVEECDDGFAEVLDVESLNFLAASVIRCTKGAWHLNAQKVHGTSTRKLRLLLS
jgi:hypothetical protein